MSASLRKFVVNGYIRWRTRGRRIPTAAEAVLVVDRRVTDQGDPRPPTAALRGVDVVSEQYAGTPVHRVRPVAPAQPARSGVVVYLHGGGYLTEAVAGQWQAAADLARRSGTDVLVVQYPLAPQSTAATTVPLVADVIEEIQRETGPAVVVGDSAGAGLALAATMQLRDTGRAMPRRLMLVSPWLDLLAEDPEQPGLQRADRIQNIEVSKEYGRRYAGDLDPADWRASPLFGDLRSLPPTSVFAGTADILIVDARRFAVRAREAQSPVELREYPGAMHTLFVTPFLAECREVRSAIAAAARS